MFKNYFILILLLIGTLSAMPAFVNGDFEDGTEGEPTGWQGGPAFQGNLASFIGYHEDHYVYINGDNTLTQTVSGLDPNKAYTVKFLASIGMFGWKGQYVDINGQKIYPKDRTFSEFEVKLPTGTTAVTVKAYGGDNSYFNIQIDYFRLELPESYCYVKSLPEGFNIVDPDGGDNKNSFEIFCYKDANSKMHDLIALPIKNSSNNFVFDNNETTVNYYDTTANPRTDFHTIEVALNYVEYNGTLENGAPKPYFPVITGEQRKPADITTNGNTYKIMKSTFSNINLIATPFEIDWSNTNIDECNATQLRKALNQAVKYNTLIQDKHSICHINKMSISLQDKYRYLTYLGDEVLKKSCKEMAEYVPNNVGVLDDTSIAGYFNIDPFEKGRGGLDIGEKGRPITAWCKYQQDLGWVWTFLTALDAKVTNSKIDLMNKEDTCSELGLYFFVPNSKETFDRVRKYLKNKKSGDKGWENYTGTIREKYKAYTNDPNKEYYLRKIGYELIWPYGPLGIYYPCDGHKDATNGCTYRRWYSGKYYIRTWMSGAAMHNIPTMNNYLDSMGHNGWVSILGEQDLNKTNEWWVSDVGAGEEVGYENPSRYEYSPHGIHKYQSVNFKYYEPNGNYKKYAWLNFVHDSEGWIYHNDDNNDFYAYYDYLCMSETNYDTTTRYALVPGFFNVIERSTSSGNSDPNFSDDQIRTKIVNKDIILDVILYKYDPNTGDIDKTQLEEDENKSVGVFLSTFNDKGELKLLKYLDDLENFDQNNGRIELSSFKLGSAVKEAYVHFYYCNPVGMNWQECWNFNGSTNYPIVTKKNDLAGESDSYDKFAIRPNKFLIDINVSQNSLGEYYTTAGKEIKFTFEAKDYTNQNTINYNEKLQDSNSSYIVSYDENKSGCINGIFTPVIDNNWSFSNGSANIDSYYSEVGKLSVYIGENIGSEFAIVDSDDTDIHNRLIKEYNITINFSPDHFKIDSIQLNNNKNSFTYLSKKLDMAALIDLNITAQNAKDITTTNYNSKCYAKDINITANLIYDPNTFSPNDITELLYNLYYDNNIKLIDDTNSSITKLEINNIDKKVFSDIDKGKANLSIHFNYPRAFNEPINPFDTNTTDINIVDEDTIKGSKVKIGKSRFYYAKVKSKSDFYDDILNSNVNTPIAVTIFCNKSTIGCEKFGIDTNSSQTDEYDWWLNINHIYTDKNGQVELATNKTDSYVDPSTVTNFINGIDTNVSVVYPTTSPRPVIVKIEPTPNMIANYPWLLYNASQNLPPKYIYRVRFIDMPNAWSGKGKTGYTIDVNSSGKKSKKVDW